MESIPWKVAYNARHICSFMFSYHRSFLHLSFAINFLFVWFAISFLYVSIAIDLLHLRFAISLILSNFPSWYQFLPSSSSSSACRFLEGLLIFLILFLWFRFPFLKPAILICVSISNTFREKLCLPVIFNPLLNGTK